MSQNRGVWVLHRLDDSVRLLLAVHAEPAVDAGDDEVEARQDLVGIVERAVAKNVGLDPFEDVELAAVTLVQPVDGLLLSGHFVDLKAAGIVSCLGMIGEPEISVAALA